MTQGTQPETGKDNDGTDVLDLDAMLADRSVKPRTIRFAGREWKVRTDLTGEEVVRFWSHIAKSQDEAGISILLGDAKIGKDFAAKFNVGLPASRYHAMFLALVHAAGLRTDEGDSSAS